MGGSIGAGGGGGGGERDTEGGVGTRSGYQGDTPPGVGYRSDPGVPPIRHPPSTPPPETGAVRLARFIGTEQGQLYPDYSES